jgi:hypothetical protein
MEHPLTKRSIRIVIPALGAALISIGCTFEPHIPTGTIACAVDGDCPAGFRCRPGVEARLVCCAPGACGDGADAGMSDRPAPAGDAARPTSADAARAVDADTVIPPRVMLADAGAERMDSGVDVAGTAVMVTCSSFNAPPAGVTGQEVLCTVLADDTVVTLYIDDITNHDAVTTRAEGLCWVEDQLGPGAMSSARAVPAASLDLLVGAVEQFKKVCASHHGRMIGVGTTGWARQASNQAEVAAGFKARTGLALDVPTPAQELAQAYLGVTRNRRGWLMIDRRSAEPQLIAWPSFAPAPVVYPVPITSRQADAMFFTNPAYTTFDSARLPLRAQLQDAMVATTDELFRQIVRGQLESAVAVGPADAMIPLAVAGRLQEPSGTWNDAATVDRKVAAATVTLTPDQELTFTPFGRVFGVVLPEALDVFFPAVGVAQFTQLRSDAIRNAYGRELMFITALLDILGDEAGATEFGFVFAFPHFGYLYSKVLPPSPS